MKIEQKPLEDHQIHLTVEVEGERLETARRRAARQISKRIKVPGFRPGKAPYSVVEKQVGPEAIEEEALDIVLDDLYPQVIEEAGIKPWGPGTVEKVNEDQEPRIFEIRVPLSPEVKLGNYKDVRIAQEEKPVTQADIDKVLENLRSQQAVLEPVDRAAQAGDLVTAVVSGERDKPDEQGNTTILPERSYPIVIEQEGEADASEWPFTGFSRQLIGLKAGEEKTLKHKYAKDSEFEELRGAAATFIVKIEEIKDRVLPEVTDEFAQSVGDYENVDALMAEIESTLKENFEIEQREAYENQIVDKLLEDASIKFAPQMLDHEIAHYIEDLEPRLAEQGLTLETYLKSRDMDMPALREEVRPTVEERLKRSLLLMQVAEEEGIEVKTDELEALVQERVLDLQQMLSEQDAKRLLNGDNLQGLVNRTLSREIVRRTLARLRAIASGQGEAAAESEEPAEEGNRAPELEQSSAKQKEE